MNRPQALLLCAMAVPLLTDTALSETLAAENYLVTVWIDASVKVGGAETDLKVSESIEFRTQSGKYDIRCQIPAPGSAEMPPPSLDLGGHLQPRGENKVECRISVRLRSVVALHKTGGRSGYGEPVSIGVTVTLETDKETTIFKTSNSHIKLKITRLGSADAGNG